MSEILTLILLTLCNILRKYEKILRNFKINLKKYLLSFASL